MIVDSHAHYDDEKFDEDRAEVMKRIHKQGVVRVVNPSSDLESVEKCIQLADDYDFIYTAVGLHPHEAKSFSLGTVDMLRETAGIARLSPSVRLGWIIIMTCPKKCRKSALPLISSLQKELSLPLIIHDREAHQDILDIIRSEKAYTVGGVSIASREALKWPGRCWIWVLYLLGGAVTFKNARRPVDVAKYVPR